MLARQDAGLPEHALDPLATGILVEHGPVGERIDVQRFPRRTTTDDEVPRRADAKQVEPRPLPDRGVDNRQRNGDAQSPCQHVVQIAIARIIIRLFVAAESGLLVEQLADGRQLRLDPAVRRVLDRVARLVTQRGNARQRCARIQIRVGVPREFQHQPHQIDTVVTMREQLGELRVVGKRLGHAYRSTVDRGVSL